MPSIDIYMKHPFCNHDVVFSTRDEAQNCAWKNLLREPGEYSISPILDWSETWPRIDWHMQFKPIFTFWGENPMD